MGFQLLYTLRFQLLYTLRFQLRYKGADEIKIYRSIFYG